MRICEYTKIHWFICLQFSSSVVSDSLRPHGLHAAGQASLFITNSQSVLKLMSIELVMPSNHLILLPLLPSIFSTIRVFSNKLALQVRWKSIGASASVLPMNIQDWFPLGLTCLISLQSKGLSRVFSSTTIRRHQFFSAQPFLLSSSQIYTCLLEKP